MLVRKARCPGCGSPKGTPNTAAYIYCDYCGQLMDLDLAKIARNPIVPDPASEKLTKQLKRKVAAARASGDRNQLMACHQQLQDQHLRDHAAMYSPRLADPGYRSALVDYLAYQEVVRDLDPRMPAIVTLVTEANAGLEFDQQGERYVVRPSTLWPIVDANRQAVFALLSCLGSFPDPVPDPDGTAGSVATLIAHGLFVHAWLGMVDDATAAELLERTGLSAGYEEVPDPELCSIHCTACGKPRVVPVGSRRALCESCGTVTELATASHCSACNASVVFGLGQTVATCSHCQTQARIVERST